MITIIPTGEQFKKLLKFVLGLLAGPCALLAFIISALSIIGLFGSQGWLMYLCAIFRVQYCTVLLIGVPIFWLARKWITLAVTSSVLLLNLILIVPVYFAASPAAETSNLRILQMNVNRKNRNFEKTFACIRDLSPDVICLEEIDEAWKDALLANLSDYPNRLIAERKDDNSLDWFRFF